MSTVTVVDAGPLRSEDQTLRELPLTAVQLRIASPPGGPTTLLAELPCGS